MVSIPDFGSSRQGSKNRIEDVPVGTLIKADNFLKFFIKTYVGGTH